MLRLGADTGSDHTLDPRKPRKTTGLAQFPPPYGEPDTCVGITDPPPGQLFPIWGIPSEWKQSAASTVPPPTNPSSTHIPTPSCGARRDSLHSAGGLPAHPLAIIPSTTSKSPASALGDTRAIATHNLRDVLEDTEGAIRHTSINKAKGLDSRAVILIGCEPVSETLSDWDAYAWFMGVSRARQLLAVVGRNGIPGDPGQP